MISKYRIETQSEDQERDLYYPEKSIVINERRPSFLSRMFSSIGHMITNVISIFFAYNIISWYSGKEKMPRFITNIGNIVQKCGNLFKSLFTKTEVTSDAETQETQEVAK